MKKNLDSTPLAVQRELDAICDRFESALRSGGAPCLQQYIDLVENEYRPLLQDLLTEIENELATKAKGCQTLRLDQPFPETPGRYRIERKLGEGAMGTVYLAQDRQLERPVALKFPKVDSDAEALERFRREARLAATLHHPNICPVYDIGESNGQPYISMAYIEGTPLSEIIENEKQLSEQRIAILARGLAFALDAAHREGIVHRDLKPSNIIINREDEPVIMDFGMACQVRQEQKSRLTQIGSVFGSPAYMSPEQVRGETDRIGPSSDIYSLGIVVYELCTGKLPFDGPSTAVFGQILSQEPEPPSKLRPGLDPKLEAICWKLIAKQPKDRYSSMAQVAKAFSDFLNIGTSTPQQFEAFDSSRPEFENHPTRAGIEREAPSSRTSTSVSDLHRKNFRFCPRAVWKNVFLLLVVVVVFGGAIRWVWNFRGGRVTPSVQGEGLSETGDRRFRENTNPLAANRLQGGEKKPGSSTPTKPVAGKRKLYWITELAENTNVIRRANLDGTEIEDVIQLPFTKDSRMHLDFAQGRFYFTRSNPAGVYATSLEDQMSQTLLTGEQLGTSEVYCVRVVGDRLYVGGHKFLLRCNLDGSQPKRLDSPFYPSGFAVSADQEWIAYTSNDRICRIAWRNDEMRIRPCRSSHCYALCYDGKSRQFFWIDQKENTIYASNEDGSNLRKILDVDPMMMSLTIDGLGQRLFFGNSQGIESCTFRGEDRKSFSDSGVNANSLLIIDQSIR